MRRAFLATLLLAGCTALPPVTTVPDIVAAGPMSGVRNIIYGAERVFRDPASVRGLPGEAAVAVAQLEWLAREVPRDLTFYNFDEITGPALGAARSDVRRAVGIASDAPTQAVVDGLGAAARSLAGGDEAAARGVLVPPVFSPDTLARLGALPSLPQANLAMQRTVRDLEFGRNDLFSALAR